ncbi:YceI family protein [Algoriphagus winogradskyi]|jgi:polyisoprenoid-binding protein YceI|uniref:Polyisoprenoid-binding protein YceI n=1 Tax=Algoriphagus winogradskyi TaxID=237017 RepID=A0ABY1NCP1_9BACT|nr:YceI family protein [Algoriphagus winogradskyi]SMP06241.1 Polyisoprenoid-binding protein YceI [Algoriphagus winogradskyi]
MKTIKQSGFILAAALLTFACGQSGETVETSEAQEVAAAEGTTLSIDKSATAIKWKGYKPTGQHNGIIPIVDGSLAVQGENITGGEFTFDITKLEVHDLEAGSEMHGKLTGHLQSADFFDAENHPTAKFEITSVEPFTSSDSVTEEEQYETENTPSSATELNPETPTHWISGNLTMRGTTKNIKFPATVSITNGTVAAKAGFNIDRTEWGLSYQDESSVADKAADKFIYNSVGLILDVKAN